MSSQTFGKATWSFVRAHRKDLGWIFAGPTAAVVAAAVLLASRGNGGPLDTATWSGARFDPGYPILIALLLATVIHVLINTGYFFAHILKLALDKQSLLKTGDAHFRAAVFATGISIIVASIWAGNIFNGFMTAWNEHSNEVFALTVFALFLYIDLELHLSCRAQLAELADPNGPLASHTARSRAAEQRRLELDSQLASLQLWLIDAPVLIGVMVVLLITHLDSPPVPHGFMTGFTAGAIAMHLAVSQVIFGILTLRDLYVRSHSP